MGQQAIIITVLASVLLTFTIFSLMTGLGDSSATVGTQFNDEQALNVATSGVNQAISRLRQEKKWRGGYSKLSIANGTCNLTLSDVGVDSVQITSVGSYGGTTHRSVARVKLSSIFPTVTSALTVFGDSVSVTNSGKAWLVDGNDHTVDGSAGTHKPVDGIGVQSSKSATDVKAQLKANDVEANVQGKSGAPSVGTFPNMDLAKLHEFYKSIYTIKMVPGKYADNRVFGSLTSPEIVYVPGSLEWAGTITGYGILVVDGALALKGKVAWYGIVLTMSGDVTLELGGSGTPSLIGTTFIGSSSTSKITNVKVNGNPTVAYSYDILEAVMQNLGLLQVEVYSYWE